MKNFVVENFLSDLQEELQTIEISNPDISLNSISQNLTSSFENVLDKYAPLQKLSRKEKRLTEKPWISKGILKSIKTKNKLFRSHCHSIDPNKKLIYKKHLNKLTHIKNLAKRLHYEKLFLENQGNSQKTRFIVGELINYKNHKNKSEIPPTIEIEKKCMKLTQVRF